MGFWIGDTAKTISLYETRGDNLILPYGAALATVVGVLVEVPVMLMLVRIANKTRHYFMETDHPEK